MSWKEIDQKCSEVGQTEVKNEGTFLVCFTGGCTHSELNSLRRVAERQTMKYQIVRTHLFSSNDFCDAFAVGMTGSYLATFASRSLQSITSSLFAIRASNDLTVLWNQNFGEFPFRNGLK
jgi:hypothetical protein